MAHILPWLEGNLVRLQFIKEKQKVKNEEIKRWLTKKTMSMSSQNIGIARNLSSIDGNAANGHIYAPLLQQNQKDQNL